MYATVKGLGQEGIGQQVKEIISEQALESKITELNMRLQAQEKYKQYGIAIGVGMLLLRLFKK